MVLVPELLGSGPGCCSGESEPNGQGDGESVAAHDGSFLRERVEWVRLGLGGARRVGRG
jgi:hypothetical protein